jgi:hypothetical protein
LDRHFCRASVFAGAGVLAAVNAQADQIIETLRYQSLMHALDGLAGISAIIWFALYAALKVGFEGEPEDFRKYDPLVLSLVLASLFVPITFAAQAGLLLCGSYLFASSQPGGRSRRVALVLLALTGPLVWGRIALHAFAAPILALDAHVVGSVIGATVDGNTVHFANARGQFLIGGPCSSVHNISLAVVLWTSAVALFKVRVDARIAAFGLAMIAMMFAINIARLAAIGANPDNFDFLHHGIGAGLFGWAGLIGCGFLAALGVSDAVARQR